VCVCVGRGRGGCCTGSLPLPPSLSFSLSLFLSSSLCLSRLTQLLQSVLSTLIDHGADLDRRDTTTGATPLIEAARSSFEMVLQVLLHYVSALGLTVCMCLCLRLYLLFFSVCASVCKGATPLIEAARSSFEMVLQVLLHYVSWLSVSLSVSLSLYLSVSLSVSACLCLCVCARKQHRR
jgi:ankyrin repeat protein